MVALPAAVRSQPPGLSGRRTSIPAASQGPQQVPPVVTGTITHPLEAAVSSLPHFPTPLSASWHCLLNNLPALESSSWNLLGEVGGGPKLKQFMTRRCRDQLSFTSSVSSSSSHCLPNPSHLECLSSLPPLGKLPGSASRPGSLSLFP